jgi:tetratricopeptide (TPR) repeat protein
LAAEKDLSKALRLNPKLGSSHYQLARVYQRQAKYQQALEQIDAAQQDRCWELQHPLCARTAASSAGPLRGSEAEMEATTRMMNEQRDKRQKELYGGPVPNPELTREPQ